MLEVYQRVERKSDKVIHEIKLLRDLKPENKKIKYLLFIKSVIKIVGALGGVIYPYKLLNVYRYIDIYEYKPNKVCLSWSTIGRGHAIPTPFLRST